jgi:hypothetical protein
LAPFFLKTGSNISLEEKTQRERVQHHPECSLVRPMRG